MTTLHTRARAATGDALLVTRRRAAQDAALLAGTAVLLLGTLLLTLALPRLMERSADEAVRRTLSDAGTAADVVGLPPYAGPFVSDRVSPVFATADLLDDELGDLVEAPVAALRTPTFEARTPAGAFLTRLETVVESRDRDAEHVRWVAGRAPQLVPAEQQPPGGEGPRTVEAGLSAPAAAEIGLDLAGGPVRITMGRESVSAYVLVTGLYEPLDLASPVWRDAADLLGAMPTDEAASVGLQAGLYVPHAGLADLRDLNPTARLDTSVRARPAADSMTLASARSLGRQVERLAATTGQVAGDLPDVLGAFETRLTAARAQASLVVVGLAATGSLCLVLAAGLLADRRRAALAGERARGASLASVVLRALAESLPVVLAVGGLAWAVVTAVLPAHRGSVSVALAVAAVAVLAPPVLAARTAAGAWTGRRVPADRRVRARLEAGRQVRRVVVEALVVVLAVASVVSVRTRGLVPGAARDVDLLLAAAPVLVAAAASLLVVRVAPAVVRAAGRPAARARG
ncbi:hypothetical protein, partial [Cellulomonas shaoxiangyii]